jgi:hypothetical protein
VFPNGNSMECLIALVLGGAAPDAVLLAEQREREARSADRARAAHCEGGGQLVGGRLARREPIIDGAPAHAASTCQPGWIREARTAARTGGRAGPRASGSSFQALIWPLPPHPAWPLSLQPRLASQQPAHMTRLRSLFIFAPVCPARVSGISGLRFSGATLALATSLADRVLTVALILTGAPVVQDVRPDEVATGRSVLRKGAGDADGHRRVSSVRVSLTSGRCLRRERPCVATLGGRVVVSLRLRRLTGGVWRPRARRRRLSARAR